MKIHVSMETKILLDSCGSYFLEPRGLIVFPVSQTSAVTKYWPLIGQYMSRDLNTGL